MEDLVGLGKASEHLLQHISNAIGTLYKPRAIKLEEKAKSDAKIYDLEKTADSYLRIMKKINESEDVLRERTINRIRSTELGRQLNIDNIVTDAIQMIEETSTGSDPDDLSMDWMNKYFDYVKDISDRDIQNIWSKILARQAIKSKRNISLITLDSLRLLESLQAKVFYQICRRVGVFRSCFPFILDEFESQNTQDMSLLYALQELGLIDVRNLRSPGEVEYLYFPFSGFAMKLIENIDFEGSYYQITEAGLSFRGMELARVLFGDELTPSYENFKVPSLNDSLKFMNIEEQSSTLRYWFNLFQEKGGYTINIILKKDKEDQILLWNSTGIGKIVSNNNQLGKLPEVLKFLV